MNKQIYVWDPLVRIFHWTLVLAFIIAYVTGEEANALHIYSGYYILGLVAFRIIWGVIGTHYARFSHFSFSPAAVKAYLLSLIGKGKASTYIGHNPAGSWMVIVMLISLVLTGISGLQVYGLEGYGPLAQNTTHLAVTQGNPAAGFVKVSGDDDERGRQYQTKQKQDSDSEEFWEEIHEFVANLTVLLVLLHIAGVALSSFKHGKNLVRAMVTGYKQ